jgi:Zn-dependent oligopeptidase
VATKEAVERTEKRMALNHLLVLLPQFRLLENDLDHAAQEDDRPLARRTLVAYAHFATEVAAILQGQDKVDQNLVIELQSSAKEASRAKGVLIDASHTRTTRQLTKDAREAISSISMHINTLATTYQISSNLKRSGK